MMLCWDATKSQGGDNVTDDTDNRGDNLASATIDRATIDPTNIPDRRGVTRYKWR